MFAPVVLLLALATGNAAVDLDARDFAFMPTEVRVPPGATVVWRNVGSAPHSVTAFDGSFQSDAQPGTTATFVAPLEGVHPFVCAFHDWMKGNLTIDAAATRATPVPVRHSPAAGWGVGLLAVAVVGLRAKKG